MLSGSAARWSNEMFKEGFTVDVSLSVMLIKSGSLSFCSKRNQNAPKHRVFIGEKGFNLAQSNAILSDRMQTLEKLDINKNRVLSAI